MSIIGYIRNGDYLCLDCSKHVDFLGPVIFGYSEFDYPPHCGDCGCFIGGVLTNYGVRELIQEYRDGQYRTGICKMYFDEYLSHYFWINRFFIWTFVGMIDPDGNLQY